MHSFMSQDDVVDSTHHVRPTIQHRHDDRKGQPMKRNSNRHQQDFHLGAFLIAASLVWNPITVEAHPVPGDPVSLSPFSSSSSSIQLAESIKVLDMSLPTYGAISSPKATQESIKGVEPEKETATSTSILPSKKSTSSKKIKSEKKSTKVISDIGDTTNSSDDEKKDLSIKFMDMSMPSYSESATTSKKSVFAL